MGRSLYDVGYCSVGVDEGWESCTRDVHSRPLPNASAFPNLSTLVTYAHGSNLTIGWYLNGCKCKEQEATLQTYKGDIAALNEYQFDGVKLDDCGPHHDFTLYASLIQKSGKNVTIEVHNPSAGACQNGDMSTCPTREWCPFNWYRTSHDISTASQSWVRNLQSTIPFQSWDSPLSQPGCWAYPDMLEVGRVAEPAPGAFLSWNRAHFGAWCVTSSPLILGLELTDTALQPILEIIGNSEAILVNQQWAGHPGSLVSTQLLSSGTPGTSFVQLWVKPQYRNAKAAFVLNNSPNVVKFVLEFRSVNITEGSASVRDIWQQRDLGSFHDHMLLHVPAYDSAFLRITPMEMPVELV